MKKRKTREDQAVDMEKGGQYFGRPDEVRIAAVAVQAPGITMGVHGWDLVEEKVLGKPVYSIYFFFL